MASLEEDLAALQPPKETPRKDPPNTDGLTDELASLQPVNKYAEGARRFGRGVVSGLSFDTAGKPTKREEFEEGSLKISESGLEPKSFSEKYITPRNLGKVTGGLIPLVLSELTAGLPASVLITKYGLGPVKAAFAQGGMTGMIYGATRGGVKGRNPLQTVADMGSEGLAFGALGVAARGAGMVGEALTKDVPEFIGTQYVGTPPAMAQSARRKGQDALGKEFLDRTKYGGGQSKNQVYDDIGREISDNRFVIRETLKQADEAGSVPVEPTVTKEFVPERNIPFRQEPKITTEKVPERYVPYTGIKEKGALGEPVRPVTPQYPPSPTAQVPPLKQGGFTKEIPQAQEPTPGSFTRDEFGVPIRTSEPSEIPGLQPQTKLGGFEKENISGKSGTYVRGKLGEEVKVSDIQPGKGIDLDDVRGRLGSIISEQTDIGKAETANAVKELSGYFAPGEKIVSLERAYDLLGKLDAEVNTAYLKTPNAIPPGTEARAALANELRALIHQKNPEVGALLNRNHFLQSLQTSMLPDVSPHKMNTGSNWLNAFTRWAAGNRVALGVARTLQSPIVKEPIKVTAKATKQLSRMGLSEYMDNIYKKGQK